jgi:hypothetical protein
MEICQVGDWDCFKNWCKTRDGREWNGCGCRGVDNDFSRVLAVAIGVFLKLDTISPWFPPLIIAYNPCHCVAQFGQVLGKFRGFDLKS